jgi:L-rhamnose mutarotase
MTDKVAVPEGMLKETLRDKGFLDWMKMTGKPLDEAQYCQLVKEVVKAALRWQIENPIIPTREQYDELYKKWHYDELTKDSSAIEFQRICHAWQSRMFIAPEPEVCPINKALLDSGVTISNDWLCPECQRVHEAILNDKKPEVPEVSPSTELYRAFHRAWSSKVGTEGYNKDDWNKLDSLLNRCLYPQKSAE